MADMIDAIKQEIRIVDYARAVGFTPVSIGPDNWSLKEHDSVRISERDNLFFQHSTEKGGSIIDFVMQFERMDQSAAIKKLRNLLHAPDREQHFPRPASGGSARAQEEKKQFEMHPKTPGAYRRAFAYLAETRGIDAELVQQLMKDKTLYQDDKGNACFVGRDYDGQDKYGFARSTATGVDFRGDFSGSDKSVGFSVNLTQPWGEPPRRLFVSESAIDSLSLMSLAKLHGLPVEEFGYLSLSGVSPKALEYHVVNNPQLEIIYLCQDNDAAGMASRVRCREVLGELGYEGKVVEKFPKGKDFNDDLLDLRAGHNFEMQKGKEYEILSDLSERQY